MIVAVWYGAGMNLLFIHQGLPGQFKHLVPALAADRRHRVAAITQDRTYAEPGVRVVTYRPTRYAHAGTHHYVRLFENAVLHGQAVLRHAMALRDEGFRPDVVVAHPGWGEALFLRDVFPRAKLLHFCEFFYHGRGADVGFEPGEGSMDAICRARARNAHLLLSLEACDAGWSATRWQRDRHPAAFRDKISVVFDGIDLSVVRPDARARFALPDGRVLTREVPVVSYVARNLEPYRGFPSFMRALPAVLAANPAAQVVIVGGDGVSYGQPAPGGVTWRAAMEAELGPLDPARVHFTGPLVYRDYLSLLQVSRAHVYLTVPFVLSWSCAEALAAGCALVASHTPPVEEFVRHGENGLLVDFHDPAAIAVAVGAVLGGGHEGLRAEARRTALACFDLARCLPRQVELIEGLG